METRKTKEQSLITLRMKKLEIEVNVSPQKDTACYETLFKSSQGWHEEANDYKLFVKYYLSVILASYKDFANRVALLVDKKKSKTERVIRVFDSKLGENFKKRYSLAKSRHQSKNY